MKKEQVLGIIRHVLTFGGGYFVARGWVDEATMVSLTGAAITIIGTIWSIAAPEKIG